MSKNKTWWVVGTCATTALLLTVVPKLLKKYNTKLYKDSLEKRQINIDEIGPEIVKKDKVEELDNVN